MIYAILFYIIFVCFKMIIITHDDHLVDKLMIGSKPEFIYVLGKDNFGISHVRRQYSDG